MTAKRRLVPEREVESMAFMLRNLGFKLDGPIEVRTDGVIFHPASQTKSGDAYERWSQSHQGRD